MAALRWRANSKPDPPLKHPLALEAFCLFRALPDHAGKTLQRHQRLAGIGPLLQLFNRDVVERLAAGAGW